MNDLEQLAARWPSLAPEVRAAIMVLIELPPALAEALAKMIEAMIEAA